MAMTLAVADRVNWDSVDGKVAASHSFAMRGTGFLRQVAVAVLAASLLLTGSASANDSIFPARPAAAARIGWQNGFFVVDGKPTILSAGEIHYARVPRALWRDRLVRAKRAGLNTIQTYVFWNAHEGREGVFDFDDALDLDAWLSLIEELGLYAIVRPGPYNCAEWESGGLPSWLTVKSDIGIRTDDPTYLGYVDKYYEKVLPILVKHQIHKGGSLLMVQLENEHPAAWGTDSTPYLQHLYDKARSLGLDVPLYYSGLHHGHDPAGDSPFGARTVPWFSSEFWVGWFDGGGEPTNEEVLKAGRGTWKALAFGGGGYSYYVVHGGTNFGYSSDDELPTSYDYRAPIGEAGQLRRSYPEIKRASMFAQTFAALLATATDGADMGAQVAPGLRAFARKSAAGSVVFLDNPSAVAASTGLTLGNPALTLPAQGQLTLGPGEIRPIVVGAKWTDNVTFDYVTAGVLGSARYGAARYLVLYGRAGETGELSLRFGVAPSAAPGAPWTWQAEQKKAHLGVTFPAGDGIDEATIDSGDGETIHVLTVNRALADRSWFTEQALFVGPQYVAADLSLELPLAGGQATIYDAQGRRQVSAPRASAPPAPAPLTGWRWRDGAAEGLPGYDDAAWLSSPEPQPLSANDGFANGYGWYRTTFDAPDDSGAVMFFSSAMEDARAFVNGKRVDVSKSQLVFPTQAGPNSIAVLTTHEGRQKLVSYAGRAGTLGFKGLWGPVAFGKLLATLDDWRMSINGQPSTSAATFAARSFDDSSWSVVQPAPNNMGSQATYAWYRAHVTVSAVPTHGYLFLHGIDDEAWVYVNGTLAGHHADWSTPALIDASSTLVAGDNVIAICILNTGGIGGLTGAVDVIAGRPGSPWRFRGGVGGLEETPLLGNATNWGAFVNGPWQDSAPADPRPAFWRADFHTPLPPDRVASVGLRMQGVSAGSVWVNGHNLGFYHGGTLLYVPEPWLAENNTVVVFDREGKSPAQVAFEYIEVATRLGQHGEQGTPDAGMATGVEPDGGVGATGGAGGCGCRISASNWPGWGALAAALGGLIFLTWRAWRRGRGRGM